MQIKPGNIVRGPQWPEPVEIKLIEHLDTYIHIIGMTTIGNYRKFLFMERFQANYLKYII